MNKFTAKVGQIKAYTTGMLAMKVVMKSEDVASLGIQVDNKDSHKLVQIKLQKYEWEAWREDKATFPKVFGQITFTLDAIEPKHLDADPTVGRNEDMDWLEGVGFCPAGESTGSALLPEFDKLVVKKDERPSAPKGF